MVSDHCSTASGNTSVRHEVAEIVGERVELEPDGVVTELAARQACPLDGVFAFLDPLLAARSRHQPRVGVGRDFLSQFGGWNDRQRETNGSGGFDHAS